MTVLLKTKAVLACLLILAAGFACGFLAKSFLCNKSEYQFRHDFEKLEPLTKELGLSDVTIPCTTCRPISPTAPATTGS